MSSNSSRQSLRQNTLHHLDDILGCAAFDVRADMMAPTPLSSMHISMLSSDTQMAVSSSQNSTQNRSLKSSLSKYSSKSRPASAQPQQQLTFQLHQPQDLTSARSNSVTGTNSSSIIIHTMADTDHQKSVFDRLYRKPPVMSFRAAAAMHQRPDSSLSGLSSISMLSETEQKSLKTKRRLKNASESNNVELMIRNLRSIELLDHDSGQVLDEGRAAVERKLQEEMDLIQLPTDRHFVAQRDISEAKRRRDAQRDLKRYDAPHPVGLTPKQQLMLSPEEKLELLERKAKDMEKLGHFHTEIDLRVEMLALSNIAFGQNSIITAQQHVEIGRAYVNMHLYEQGTVHLEKALAILTQFLQKTSNSRLSSTSASSAHTQQDDKRYQEGRMLLPSCLLKLGICFMVSGHIKKSYISLSESRRQNLLLHGEEHGSNVDILLALAELYRRLKKSDVALKMLMNAWELRDAEVQGKSDVKTAAIYREIAKCNLELGNDAEALDMLRKSLATLEEIKSENEEAFVAFALTSSGIAALYFSMFEAREQQHDVNDLDQAISHFKSAQQHFDALFGPLDERTVGALENVAFCQLQKGKLLRDELDRQSTDIDEQDENTEMLEKLQENLSMTLAEAIAHYENLLWRLNKLYSAGHVRVAVTLEMLGDSHALKLDYNAAYLNYQKSWLIVEEICGVFDAYTAQVQGKMEVAAKLARQNDLQELQQQQLGNT